MLKSAIYANIYIIFIVSILVIIIGKKTQSYKKLKMLKLISLFYLIYNFASLYISVYSGLTDMGWSFVIIYPSFIISLILFIIGLNIVNKKIKSFDNNLTDKENTFHYKIVLLIPILIFLIPYIYELSILNNCELLLKYDYQNGIVQKDTFYWAISNDSIKKLTLQKNLFDRKNESEIEEQRYYIIYNQNLEILRIDEHYNKLKEANKIIEEIAINAKAKCPNAKSANVITFMDGKYSIITLYSEDKYGKVLEEFFYHNSNFIKKINTRGNLESAVLYK